MHDLFREKLRLFVACFIGWVIPTGYGIFSYPIFARTPVGIALEYTARLFGSVIIAAMTALATTLVIDYYKHKWKDKIFKSKNKNDEQRKEKDAA